MLERAVAKRKQETWSCLVEPTIVLWAGSPGSFVLRVPVGGPSQVDVTLTLEGGKERRRRLDLGSLEAVGQERFGRRSYTAYTVPERVLVGRRGERLPLGHHALKAEYGRSTAQAVVISAPLRCWMPEGEGQAEWGLFSPLYALHTGRDWGAGDLADLELLSEWVGKAGGSTVATLPLLAAYLDRPFEPSPYSPVSRLFWNEFYLAADRVAEWERCAAARELWGAAGVQAELGRLRAQPLVDYRAVMRLKRRVLEQLCRCFFEEVEGERRQAFTDFLAAHPEAPSYAAFRARVEEIGADWRDWPLQIDDPTRPVAPHEPFGAASPSERYHLYCQWQMDEQLGRLSSAAPGAPRLLLDVPVCVHPGGFDTWRWPSLFAQSMSVGAPPDGFFAQGQDWDCPPVHPVRDRDEGHGYFASFIAGHMLYAGCLRIDHVMSLHRLFWVPDGEAPQNGVYVKYPAEELYATLCLESHRHRTIVIGEDLGTVPPEVRTSMRRHGVLGTWVLQMSLRPQGARPVRPVPRNVIAAMNTHDMFPFAGFLRGDDITARLQTGQVDQKRARRESAARHRLVSRLEWWLEAEEAGPDAVVPPVAVARPAGGGREDSSLLAKALAYLMKSRPALVFVNVEDLLGETKAQNQPGTGLEQSNWRRKLASNADEVRRAVEDIGGWLRRSGCPSGQAGHARNDPPHPER